MYNYYKLHVVGRFQNDVTKMDVISDEDVEKGGKKGKKKNMRMMMSATICELETALKVKQVLLSHMS